MTLGSYAVSVTGNMAADQSIDLVGASIYWTGPATNSGAITVTGSGSLIDATGGTLTNAGLIEDEATDTGGLTLTGSFDNQGAGINGIIDDGAITLNGGTLTNEGTLSVEESASFRNESTVENNSGTIVNAGTFSDDYNTEFVEGAGTTSGNPIQSSGTEIDFTGSGQSSFIGTPGYLIYIEGTIASDQSVTLEPGAGLYPENGTIDSNGVIDAESTTSGAYVEGSLDNDGTLVVGSGNPA